MEKDTKKKLHALDPRFRKRFKELMSMMDESISLLYEEATHDEKTVLYKNKYFKNNSFFIFFIILMSER